jgi:sarcosine oxidase subunit alpha
LHHWHAAHGARLVERGGWQLVAAYRSPEQEAEAARTSLGVADVSSDSKIRLRGPGVAAVAHLLASDGVAPGPRGVARLLGGQVLACRLTDDHLLLLAGASGLAALAQLLAEYTRDQTVLQDDATSAAAGFCLIGPRWAELLRRLTSLDVGPQCLPVPGCAETSLAGVEALLVRANELSLPSVRVYIPWDLGEYVWERMMQVGREFSLTPMGLEALALLGAATGLGTP